MRAKAAAPKQFSFDEQLWEPNMTYNATVISLLLVIVHLYYITNSRFLGHRVLL